MSKSDANVISAGSEGRQQPTVSEHWLKFIEDSAQLRRFQHRTELVVAEHHAHALLHGEEAGPIDPAREPVRSLPRSQKAPFTRFQPITFFASGPRRLYHSGRSQFPERFVNCSRKIEG